MNKIDIYTKQKAIAATCGIGALSLLFLSIAFILYAYEFNKASYGVGGIGALLLPLAMYQVVILTSSEYNMFFDLEKMEFEWNYNGRKTLISIRNIEKMEIDNVMRADGFTDLVGIFYLKDSRIEVPTQFCDLHTIIKLKSICVENKISVLDKRA